jgi:hemerythrin superfamily protein
MNAIALLKADHRAIEALFTKLEDATRGKDAIAEAIFRLVTVHTSIEERIFYPAVRKLVPGIGELVLESLEEHMMIKWELASLALDGTSANSAQRGQNLSVAKSERFEAKMKVLRDVLMRHIESEERELFPKAQRSLGAARLNQLGAELEKAREALTVPAARARRQPAVRRSAPAARAGVARGRVKTQMERRRAPSRAGGRATAR